MEISLIVNTILLILITIFCNWHPHRFICNFIINLYFADRHRLKCSDMSSVSSFSEDEGVSEPCFTPECCAIELQADHKQLHTLSGPCYTQQPSQDIHPKCLQRRNFSLPTLDRNVLRSITAERSHSLDDSPHTTAGSIPADNSHTARYHQKQLVNEALPSPTLNQYSNDHHLLPKSAQSLPPQNANETSSATIQACKDNITRGQGNINPLSIGEEGASSLLTSALCKPEASDSLPTCANLEGLTPPNVRPQTTDSGQKVTKVPSSIKDKLLGFFQRQFSPTHKPTSDEAMSERTKRSKVKDEEYKKLVEYIMREEAELLHCERPTLEHTVSAPGSTEIFAVREFPLSSQALTRRKSRSLDEPPVIPPIRVRRKSKSLDEAPCIEESRDSDESQGDDVIVNPGIPEGQETSIECQETKAECQDTCTQMIETADSAKDIITKQSSVDKGFDTEQSCDSGNQSDSGAQDSSQIEEEFSSKFKLHNRNDSGTVVEQKIESEESCSDSSESDGDESENVNEEKSICENKSSENGEDTVSMPDNLKSRRASLELPQLPANFSSRRDSLQVHKKLSPVPSNGSTSDKSSIETDCDEWARTTEAVIRSMQNQMLRRQSAIEDYGDPGHFTTSSSGDSRLGQSVCDECSTNGLISPQSPPLPLRRGSEASTVSSDGVSLGESPSDMDDTEEWGVKNGVNTMTNSTPSKSDKSHILHQCQTNGSSSTSSSNSSSTQSSPEEEPANTYHRFYHVFREGELVDLIDRHVDNLHILNCYYDHANWCVVAEKVQVWRI